eukprot:scaffold29247_cov69-Cyclotella_meneghiniana.AAC.10
MSHHEYDEWQDKAEIGVHSLKLSLQAGCSNLNGIYGKNLSGTGTMIKRGYAIDHHPGQIMANFRFKSAHET